MPTGATDVRIKLDGADYGTLREGRYFDHCGEGDVFRHISISSPAQSGDLEILCANADALPFDSGGGGGGASVDLRRPLEAWWMPHIGTAAGSPFDVNGLPSSMPFFNAVATGGAGTPPVISIRSIRCGVCVPNGGTSGYQGAYSASWMRIFNEVGGVTAPLLSRLHARVKAFNIEALMRCEATGNSHGGAGTGTGLQLMQGDGTAVSSLAGGIAGFGVVRDAVAGANAWWQFVTRAIDAGGLSVFALPKPVGGVVTSWCKFRVELIDADPVAQINGMVNVYVNDIPALSFRDADMMLFPPTNNIAGVRTGFDWKFVAQCVNADTLNFARAHYWIDTVPGGGA